MKKLSVRTKYALALVAILVVLMGSQLAVNRLLVPRFYLNQKLDRIEEIRLSVLDFIEKCGSAETLDDAELSLTTTCEAAGVDAMIMKMSGGMPVIVFSNSSELAVYTKKGICRFYGGVEEGNLSDIQKIGRKRYLVVTDMNTKVIELN